MPSITLHTYMKDVQRRAGHKVSTSFPTSPTDEEQLVLDSINEKLRYLNNKYYLTFKLTQYTLSTTPGVNTYNLVNAPYSRTYWRITRMARDGVRRTDDTPVPFMDYTQYDSLRPSSASNGAAQYWTGIGENLVLFPAGDGGSLYTRYYGLHIGTDTTGATEKLTLTASDDLTMLNDEWGDALRWGAAMDVRLQSKADEKYKELKIKWEDWEKIFIDMHQPGEDASPYFVIAPYAYNDWQAQRYSPFFTPYQ